MKRAAWALTLLLSGILMACDVEEGDDEDNNGSTPTPTGSTSCNTANEQCGPGKCGGEGATMLPGSNCLSCHNSSFGGDDDRIMAGAAPAEEGEVFTAAGTAFTDMDGTAGLKGAIIRVTDSKGNVATMTSNSVGNFYTSVSLTPPLSAELEVDGQVRSMVSTMSTGACNQCHSCNGSAGGKISG